eukprot:4149755-Pyramimonas_sp.AAC.1
MARRGNSADAMQSLVSTSSGSGDNGAPRSLATRRGHFRHVATQFLGRGLMSEQAIGRAREYF